MSKKLKILSLLLAVVLLSGCSMRTVDQLYCLPKRSEEYNDLQSAIDRYMGQMSYCAPLSGENPQSVQMADLDGDGVGEYLLFAKGAAERPLQILIFRLEAEGYVLSDTIESTGSAFDIVEYARVDDQPGVELVVGVQVSDQVARSVSVYRFFDGKAQQMLSTNYTRFLTWDMDTDGRSDLMVLRPGESDEAAGVAELYSYRDGRMERSNEVNLSGTVDKMKRVVAGRLQDQKPAVYVASTVDESAIITDVFALVDEVLTNVSFSLTSGTSIQTQRNYYIYADDIDRDGIMELPTLMTMISPSNAPLPERQYLIRWSAMTSSGQMQEKAYSFHNFQEGWYLDLDSQWAQRIAVLQRGDAFEFFLWDEDYHQAQKLLTVYAFSGPDREALSVLDNRAVLYESEETIYSVYLEVASASYGLTQDKLIRSFHLIHSEWKSGET